MSETLLEARDLSIDYPIAIGTVRAVSGVSLTVRSGEALGLVGESGCGKSTLGLAMLRLVRPPGRITAGSISYRGRNVLAMSQRELLHLRGGNVAMIFQNPLTSLDPLFRIERQFLETLRAHVPGIDREKAMEMTRKVMAQLGIEERRLHEYPHQLSGGMRQRIMIALALVLSPDVLIADEPTTSLDVIVEAGFTELLAGLRSLTTLGMVLITHNLGLVAEVADRIAVMYAGRIVEVGEASAIFKRPLHPYTQGLIACVPNILLEQKELAAMPGSPPDLVDPAPGCAFAPRCPHAMEICRIETPRLLDHDGQQAACWLHGGRD
jgi:peptide/nickel transport system ATP-binding protein